MKSYKKIICAVLSCFVIAGTVLSSPVVVSAAAKPKLNKTAVTITRTKHYTLKLKNAVSSKVKWSSSNKSVASVKQGIVLAKKSGKANIIAKYKGKSYKCKVTVKGLVINTNAEFQVYKNDKLSVSLTNSKGKTIPVKSWKSLNTSIATITSKGIVKGVKTGSATIVCTDSNGDQYKSRVKVINPFLALKNLLINIGETDTDGNYSLSYDYVESPGEEYEMQYRLTILYNPSTNKFEFKSVNTYSDTTDEGEKYSFDFISYMYLNYNGSNTVPIISECYTTEDQELVYRAASNLSPATYTYKSTLDFNVTGEGFDEEDAKSLSNDYLKPSLYGWQTMLKNALDINLYVLGFAKL